jgi:hypothetical protein
MADDGGKKQSEKDLLAGKILHLNYQPRVSWPYPILYRLRESMLQPTLHRRKFSPGVRTLDY